MINTQESGTIRNILKWAIVTLKKSDIEFPETDADTLFPLVKDTIIFNN